MFYKILERIKKGKQRLEDLITCSESFEQEQVLFEIILSQDNNFYKMIISDYISIVDYSERMKLTDTFGMELMISNAVLWNSRKQKVNKGSYYVVTVDNRLYNILVNESIIKIDERIYDNGIIEEKILSFDSRNDDYSYTVHHHDSTGNTFYTRYFSQLSFGNLDLSLEEFLNSSSLLISNLELIENIENVIDVKSLKNCIFADYRDIDFNATSKMVKQLEKYDV